MKTTVNIPAAQYVRMSTEDQQYSIENQKVAIQEYAERFGYTVVATYADSGKSGVSIKNRYGLRSLLQDVVGGNAVFKAILVYDVSRWGRFQDADEAAHYEFLCKNAGIPIRYCAEQFENDGSMPSSVMKALKRTMAAEYSRELGVKVYQGQRRLALLGFKIGGAPAYGLRRMLISPDGSRKQILKPHERKNIKTDRIVLVPGPRKEIQCVRKIFTMGVFKRNTPRRIAAELNRQQLKFADGRPWNEQLVFRILKNSVYAGCITFGRTRKCLGAPAVRVPPERWITKQGAFTAIVDQATFDRVQRTIQGRKTYPPKSDEYLLNGMRRVLARKGKLTERLLKGRHIFDHRTYCKRFGSVLAAYRLIGYEPSVRAFRSVDNLAKAKRLRADLILQLKELFPDHARIIRLPGQNQRQVIEFDGRLRLAIHICRPVESTVSGEPRWILRVQPLERGLPALICTVDPTRTTLLNRYVVPEFVNGFRLNRIFGESDTLLTSGRKLENLGQFYEAAKEVAGWQEEDDSTTVGDVVVTERASTIRIAGKEIMLSPLKAAIFKLLVLNVGQVVSRGRLSNPVSGREIQYLTPHIHELRKKLGKQFRQRIQTIRGTGYVYVASDVESLPLRRTE